MEIEDVSGKEAAQRCGTAGAIVVSNFLTNQGHKVIISDDFYDNKKDILINDLVKGEVKTQAWFAYKRCISFNVTQTTKINTVDRRFWVILPAPGNWQDGWTTEDLDKYHIGHIVEVYLPFIHEPYRTKKGENMILVKLPQDNVVPIYRLTKKELESCTRWTRSSYHKEPYDE